jgi:hypothetical protein
LAATLFLAFADVQPNTQGILDFVRRVPGVYQGRSLLSQEQGSTSGTVPDGEVALEAWLDHLARIQCLSRLWMLLQREDRERLAPHFVWKDAGKGLQVHFASHPPAGKGKDLALSFRPIKGRITSSAIGPGLRPTLRSKDPLLAGWTYLLQELAAQLDKASVRVAPIVSWDEHRRRPALSFATEALLQALWLQLADAVCNERTFTRCRECGTWLEVAPDAARTHRRFCSHACRTRAYHQRQLQARQRHARGQSLQQIAQELGSDVATVRGWVRGDSE